ncbi:uncharacterized protein (DUF2267 family) [Pontibacter ummariensis]|uniref:Uncharacterized conserved protein, DUF2267 family n=1 Tax=Pontibacter ummariensis TaxID=1610492 RepID=A0A239IC26_9BACT|nr:DUF2267 domain-containing protein [Pontibacter ummariensis]PRY09937.1 uncharacterized protein (DUF2267 family) [Pontibacter ummariensis]SNS91107.1 Uncharacterized conserved protein, DUF2267 family [Pontibacter ummariensis]
MATNFDKFAQEGNEYVKQLAADLGHPEEKGQASILLRAVLHTLRDRITISESLHVLEQLPMFLKGMYVDHWKYRETPLKFNTMEEFTSAVEEEQAKHGERKFNWSQSTEDLVKMVFTSLGIRYFSQGQMANITAQLPKQLKALFPVESVSRH